MSIETLTPQDDQEHIKTDIDPDLSSLVGKTVFEKLAIDAETAIEEPSTLEGTKIVNSITRLPDGQTVPDDR